MLCSVDTSYTLQVLRSEFQDQTGAVDYIHPDFIGSQHPLRSVVLNGVQSCRRSVAQGKTRARNPRYNLTSTTKPVKQRPSKAAVSEATLRTLPKKLERYVHKDPH